MLEVLNYQVFLSLLYDASRVVNCVVIGFDLCFDVLDFMKNCRHRVFDVQLPVELAEVVVQQHSYRIITVILPRAFFSFDEVLNVFKSFHVHLLVPSLVENTNEILRLDKPKFKVLPFVIKFLRRSTLLDL